MLIQGGVDLEGYRGEPSELAARLGQAPRRGRRADPEARQGRHVAVAARAARREAELLEEAPVLRGVGDEDEDAGRAVRSTLDVSEPAVDAIVSDAAPGPTTAPKRETATR